MQLFKGLVNRYKERNKRLSAMAKQKKMQKIRSLEDEIRDQTSKYKNESYAPLKDNHLQIAKLSCIQLSWILNPCTHFIFDPPYIQRARVLKTADRILASYLQ